MLRRGGQDLALVLPVAIPPRAPMDIWADYDPERVRQALKASAGALVGIDRQQLLADLRAQREQASKPSSDR